METDRLKRQLTFLMECDKLKKILRRTVLMDASRRENDAEHSWHFALMASTLLEYAGTPGLNECKILRMALLHDLVEIYAGDTFAYDLKGHFRTTRKMNFAGCGKNLMRWKLLKPSMPPQ